MYGLTRATITVLGAAGAGVLIWLATQTGDSSNGSYWAEYGLYAAAGLVMALSQLLGGWTKWGWPRVSLNVFLWAFIPVLIAAGWILLAHQPTGNWFRSHVLSWSSDIGIRGLVDDLREAIPVLAFGIGLVFGFTFDTSGPRVRTVEPTRRADVITTPSEDVRPAADEPVAAERATVTAGDGTPPVTRTDDRVGTTTGTPVAPQPEPPPRTTDRT
jgi:hypothetical protein